MKDNVNELLEECLRNKDVRITKQRIAVLHTLQNAGRPLSAAEVYARLSEDFPHLRLSTVYRNLNTFVDKKIVRNMELGPRNKENYFELANGEHHHHLICVECNEIIPLDCPLKDYEDKLSKETDYTLLDHKIKIYGICPRCKNNK